MDIPNFREDERVRARYASLVERRIKAFALEHESSIRRNAATKRDELHAQYDAAQAEFERTKAIADAARADYLGAYPQYVKRLRLLEPSMVDNVRSLGAARRLYTAAQAAWQAHEAATSELRRIEHNLDQLEIEMKKALERAPHVAAEVTASAAWLAEIHAEEDVAAARAAVEAIDAEREAYAAQLAAGAVPPEIVRQRRFAEADIKHVAAPMSGVMFYRIETFGTEAYFILRDVRGALYAMPYDRRLETRLDDVFDVLAVGERIEVRRSLREGSRTPLSISDHFIACNGQQDTAAQNELRAHRRMVGEKRYIAASNVADETESKLIDALVAFATQRSA